MTYLLLPAKALKVENRILGGSELHGLYGTSTTSFT